MDEGLDEWDPRDENCIKRTPSQRRIVILSSCWLSYANVSLILHADRYSHPRANTTSEKAREKRQDNLTHTFTHLLDDERLQQKVHHKKPIADRSYTHCSRRWSPPFSKTGVYCALLEVDIVFWVAMGHMCAADVPELHCHNLLTCLPSD